MLTSPFPRRKCRPAEMHGHVAHREVQPEQWLMSTAQDRKSPTRSLPLDTNEGLPLTGREAVLALSIVLASSIAACLIVNLLSQL